MPEMNNKKTKTKKKNPIQFRQWKLNQEGQVVKRNPQKTMKKKILIIESSSPLSSSSYKNKNSKSLKSSKISKPLIIESTSSSVQVPSEKEKIESFFSEKNGNKQTDLKISEDKMINKMPSEERMNEKYIELMEKLADIMLKQGEPFRARAYQKALETIMSFQGDIMGPDDLKGKPGIGSTIMEKLKEFNETGTLKVLEREKNNPVNILGEVYGIGPKKAKELVDSGITSIQQLRENQDKYLNEIQKVGLRYYEDILKRIPRSEIEEYKNIFEKAFPKGTDGKMEIVGSYRRGAQSSGDIDIIITSKSSSVFTNFIDNLIKEKIIIHVLSRGPTKCLVIAKIPSSDSYRRVDFLYTSPEEFPFAILYFTGSKIFNTVMRHQALTMGLTMNEHGLYKMEGKKKGEKVVHIFKNESDIFDYLNIEYKEPIERTDGRAVIVKEEENKETKETKETKEKEEKEKEEKEKEKVKPTFIIESDSEEEIEIKPKSKVTTKTLKKKDTSFGKKKTEKILSTKLVIESDDESEVEKMIEKKSIDNYVKDLVEDFKKNGISVLEQLNENQLSSILREANKAYYNELPLMTDNEYDIVKDFIESKYPKNIAIKEIGAPIERNKVKLPYEMASMDKIKPDTDALEKWTKKFNGPYVISCKLDGVSGLYSTEGDIPKLYTRGDGKVGQDISHLIPYLRLPKTKNIVIRGEFIIPKKVFEDKYKTKFANPRNMVSGIVNHKTISESVKDLHFVAYELIEPIKKPSEQMEFIGTLDVERVLYKVENNLTNESLSDILVNWRKEYIYEIDGIIVTDDKIYERKSGNPEHAFAFKMVLSDQIAEAKVVDVIWTPSKDGYLKPRVQIEPIQLGGVKIEFATGNNAAFIENNKIGIGAVIELIRSGDVIPKIIKVTSAAEKPKMPLIPYKWNDTHVDIMIEDIESDEIVKEKNITGFFRGIGVEGLSSGNVSRIIKAGYDSIPQILQMSVDDLLQVEGFKIKTAQKIHDGIKNKINEASLVSLMSSSNLFGRGFSEKKIELIMESYPNVLLSNESDVSKISKISSIKGMALKSSEAFVEKIPDFINFMKEAGLVDKLKEDGTKGKKVLVQDHPLSGKTVVITGFRDKQLDDILKGFGAKLSSSVSKNTFVVIVKNKDEDTGKAEEAKKIGIPIMTIDEFKNKYL
jgi:DNA ligase (NAD+)